MTIGIPKAFFYYRYGQLWESFFRFLGCEVLLSDATTADVIADGARYSVDESCLPFKIYMGHISYLEGRCDRILVPRFERLGRDDEFCMRFFGVYDAVRNTFPQAELLGYNIAASRAAVEAVGFIAMGKALGKNAIESISAYKKACKIQDSHDTRLQNKQKLFKTGEGLNILLAAQPYILHDLYISGPIARSLKALGVNVLYSDRLDLEQCRIKSKGMSPSLYWVINKEIMGAVELCKDQVDGVMLLTAFPCGTDSLTNDIIKHRAQGLPIAELLLDEQQGDAGLQTRIESFVDMLSARKRAV